MTLPRLSRILVVLLVALPALSQDIIPMAKGTTWVYLARVKWAGQGSDVGTKTLRWTATITDSFHNGDIEAALLHGGPWDLAWYSPEVKPKDYLIVRIADTYYAVMDDTRETLASLKSADASELQEKLANDIWFRVPMQISDDYCAHVQEKTAPFYCWSVEKVTTTHSLRIPGFSPKAATEYFLSFMTNPDTTTVTLVPGAGIVTYDYEHH